MRIKLQDKAKEILGRTKVEPNPVDGFDVLNVWDDPKHPKTIATLIPEQGGLAVWEAYQVLEALAKSKKTVED